MVIKELNIEELDIIQWLIARLDGYMRFHCKPDDPDWQELEQARHILLGLPIQQTEPVGKILGET